MVFCLFEDTPPRTNDAKPGSRKAQQQDLFFQRVGKPNEFGVALKDAPCTEPVCCCLSGLCIPWGCTACWGRNAVLEAHFNGITDFRCFQGYITHFCCFPVGECFPGSPIGLCLEGCCCTTASLSIARIYLMDARDIRPDPCDWQIIRFSNCLQLLSCICHLASIFNPDLREVAQLIDTIADAVTLTVAGCMGAQIYHELKKSASQVAPTGAPPVAELAGAPPALEMVR